MVFGELSATWLASEIDVSGKTIAEIGSDENLYFSHKLLEMGAKEVFASNVSANWCAVTPKAGAHIVTANVDTIHADLGISSFDIIAGVNIVEHISNLSRALNAIYAALKPGGSCWLHGDPLWTSARGHHIITSARNFDSNVPIVPPWAHLYMSRLEMNEWIGQNNLSVSESEIVKSWVYTSFEISRNSRSRILQDILNSRLELVNVSDGLGEIPDSKIIDRIKRANLWWNPIERYDCRGIILHMRKR